MIAAVIPTRYHPPELGHLLAVLLADGVQPIVLESGDYNHRIYRMWNAGVEKARIIGATEIAVLNDDITILPGALPALATALRSDRKLGVVYPDVRAPLETVNPAGLEITTGTWGARGMTGFCFVVKAEIHVPFDEAYHWWYGDDAFEQSVRLAGYEIARVVGVPIRHAANGSASKRWDELQPLIAQDRARWDAHVAWRERLERHYATQDKERAE